ncbi:MAG: hypothetical protein HYT80_10840 [Euryarchaeota archaeon]|nr:hypothetical protein [Euryarchaeota archaeon]
MQRVPDPNRIAVDRKTGKLITADIPYILNPVDLNTIELALQLKEATAAEVVALSIDEPAAEFEMREALAMGCDRALLLADEAFEKADTLAQASLFRTALDRFVKPQVVLAASRSIDHNWSTVGPQLAQLLDWPLLIEAESLELREGRLGGVAHTGAYRARVEAEPPLVVTVARDANRPRTPSSWGVAKAFDEKNVEVKTLRDLGVDPTTRKTFEPKTRLLRVQQQDIKRERRRLEGEPAEVGRLLARRLVDQGWVGRRP